MLPADFERDLWLDPLTFFGLVGSSIVGGFYSDLFRADGFSKSKAEIWLIPKAREYLEREGVTPPLPLIPLQPMNAPNPHTLWRLLFWC